MIACGTNTEFGSTGGSAVRLSHHGVLFREGDAVRCHYRIHRGLVRLFRLMPDGRRHVSAFVFPGEIAGFGDFQSHSGTAEAVCETVVSRQPVWSSNAGETDPRTFSRVLHKLARDLAAARQRSLVLSRMTAEERIANFLMEVGDRIGIAAGAPIPVTMPRADIADYLGLTTETVCRVLARLKAAGVISAVGRSNIKVSRTDQFQKLACAA